MTEVEKEILKDKIVSEVEDKIKNKWHKHPLIIIAVSFILTSIIGSKISNRITTSELDNRQSILYQEKILSSKLEIISQLNQDLGSVLSAVESLTHNMFIFRDSIGFVESRANYSKKMAMWKAKSKATRANLFIYFDSAVWNKFEQIDSAFFNRRGGNSIYINGINLLDFGYADLDIKKDTIEEYCVRIMQNRNFISESVKPLTSAMKANIEKNHSNLISNDN